MTATEWLMRITGYRPAPQPPKEIHPVNKEVDIKSLHAEDMVGIMKTKRPVQVTRDRSQTSSHIYVATDTHHPTPPFHRDSRVQIYTQSSLNKMSTDEIYAVLSHPDNKGKPYLANVRIEFINRVRKHIRRHVKTDGDSISRSPKISMEVAREYYRLCKHEGTPI